MDHLVVTNPESFGQLQKNAVECIRDDKFYKALPCYKKDTVLYAAWRMFSLSSKYYFPLYNTVKHANIRKATWQSPIDNRNDLINCSSGTTCLAGDFTAKLWPHYYVLQEC